VITADIEGNWQLHRESMKALTAFNCLRYSSWFLERIEVLEIVPFCGFFYLSCFSTS
jgi:hypothetical protein